MSDRDGSPEYSSRFQAKPVSTEPRIERFSRTKALPAALALLTVVGVIKAGETFNEQSHNSQTPAAPEEFHQNPWADEVRIRIEQNKPNEGEKIEKDLVITDGGKPQVEYINDQPVLTDTVEVFIGFPSPIYPEGDHMTPSGRIAIGANIEEALITKGIIIDHEPGGEDGPKPIQAKYGAFEKGNLEVIGADQKPLELDPNTILAIPANNLADANASPQPQS